METNQACSPFDSLGKDQGKVRHFRVQMEQVYNAFRRKPSTMLMVATETGILRANICWYVAEWQRQGKIQLANKGICSISKHRAGYYSTNPELFQVIVEPSKATCHE